MENQITSSADPRQRDERCMIKALRLASLALGQTAPNPAVGAVIVRDGRIIGKGWHRRAGLDHAEVAALKDANQSVVGAEMYVTLEPCSHYGRTPPCADALIAAGLRRVIVAVGDPNPKVQGRGVARLREAGIEVTVGVCRDKAIAINEAFMQYHLTGRPLVTCKWAMTLDGQTATPSGDSKWISNDISRRFVHRMRSLHDGVMAGIGTVLADNPMLNVRLPRYTGRQPIRVIVDGRLLTPPDAHCLNPDLGGPTWILTADDSPSQKRKVLEGAGRHVFAVPHQEDGRIDLEQAIQFLGREKCQSLFVEGGPRIHAALMQAGLCDRVVVFIAPIIIGSLPQTPRGPVSGWALEKMAQANSLRDVVVKRFGLDICLLAATRSWRQRFGPLLEDGFNPSYQS